MAGRLADQIAEYLAPPEAFDPADADGLNDDTVAIKRKKRKSEISQPIEAKPEKRLRLRQSIPVLPKYKGKKVSRKEAFGEEDEEVSDDAGAADDGEGDGSDGDITGAEEPDEMLMDAPDESSAGLGAGGFNISGDLEAEYQKMMKKSSKELEIMHKPTASEVASRQQDATALKKQNEAWNAMLEFRIHLESALSLGHRLPVGDASAAFQEVEPTIGKESNAVAEELQGFLGELMALQGRLLEPQPLRDELLSVGAAPNGEGEASAWNALDTRMKKVLDWGLEVADDWKEKTRLDARKSFKVLDQSLRMQMQAVQELDAEKLKRRSRPPPGRHKVFGAAPAAEGAEEDEEGVAGIFDDREFYVQLLREVLSAGSNGKTTLSDEAKQMQAELQGRRSSKKKARAEVERRASKGRKIRYKAIEKLQNFMAPRPRGAPGAATVAVGGLGLLGERVEDEAQPAALRDEAVEALLRSLFAPS